MSGIGETYIQLNETEKALNNVEALLDSLDDKMDVLLLSIEGKEDPKVDSNDGEIKQLIALSKEINSKMKSLESEEENERDDGNEEALEGIE